MLVLMVGGADSVGGVAWWSGLVVVGDGDDGTVIVMDIDWR